jgi:2,3-bisphosphoglycerate-dependent phosphoglycerate mutase
VPVLILLRHGQSEWNAANRFTGWYDCDLSAVGEDEARAAGRQLAEAGLVPDTAHTSVQTRAIRTTELVLEVLGRPDVPIHQDWRLNERHYGNLTGLDKANVREHYGEDQLRAWRRGYSTPPPAIDADNPHNPNGDDRYSKLPEGAVPLSECLADVLTRLLPYWQEAIVPDLAAGRVVLVSAHGNSLRALCKHLDHIGDDEISELNIPTGIPLIYELNDSFQPVDDCSVLERALDPESARTAAEAVNRQTG